MLRFLLLSLGLLAAHAQTSTLQVLHINDNHARFDPADTQFGTRCNGTAADACFGGFPRQISAINSARQAAARRGHDTLVLHAGDQFTGTLFDAVYTRQGVQIAPEFLKMAGVQAFALGNHEFDGGPSLLAGFIANISGAFPVLSCNLDASREPLLEGLVQRFALIDLPRSNLTVGVVGLTSVETPETSNPGDTLSFLPYNETLPACVDDALAAGADFIIALTHIGYDADLELAASAAAAGVSLIVGGHTHTLLWGAPQPAGQPQAGAAPPQLLVSPPTNESATPQGPYPTLVLGADGSVIPVVTAQFAGRYLGQLNITYEAGRGLVAASGAPLLLGGANSTNPVEDDPVAAARVAQLRQGIDAEGSAVVGSAAELLDGERPSIRNGETNLADLMADAVALFARNSTSLFEAGSEYAGRPVVVLLNGGVFRASISQGTTSRNDIISVFPFGNWFVAKEVEAPALVAALNNGASGWLGSSSSQGRFAQVGGALRYAFDPSLPEEARLVAAQLNTNGSWVDNRWVNGEGAWVPLESYAGKIVLLTTDYLSGGGDFYSSIAEAPLIYDSSRPLDEILAAWFARFSPVSHPVDGRVANCAATPTAPLCAGRSGAGAPAPAPAPAQQAAAQAAAPAPALRKRF